MYETGQIPASTKLQDRYIIVESAGHGGMGHVYKAIDTKEQHRLVAIKEMGQRKLTEHERIAAQKRFEQEAQMTGNLAHCNLPRMYGLFEEEGRFFIVMEFIVGKTLQQLITEAPGHQIPIDDVLHYAIQLCDVFSYLHGQSPPIIFRDLKPSNVMITDAGQLYLIDFGIARSFKPGQSHDTELFGSWGFCPPELMNQQTEPRSDLFSLGATLYYCLTGHHPKANKPTPFNFPKLRPMNKQVSPELEMLILHLVATDIERRPASAYTVWQRLTELQRLIHASTTTLNIDPTNNGMGSFYDGKTARVIQVQYWLMRANKFSNWFNIHLIPLMAKIGGNTWTFFSSVFMPFCARLGRAVLSGRQNWLLSASSFLNGIAGYPGRFFNPNRGRSAQSRVSQELRAWMAQVQRLQKWFPQIVLYGIVALLFVPISLSTAAFALGLCVLFQALTASADAQSEKNYKNRALLVTTGMVAFLICLALIANTDVRDILAAQTPQSLSALVIIFLALIALVPFANYYSWIDHCLLIMVAFLYASQQYVFGAHILQKMLAVSADSASSINTLFLALAGGVIVLSLLSLPFEVSFLYRLLCIVIVLLAIEQQWILGMQELSAVFGATPQLAFAVLNLLVIIGLIVLVLYSFRIPAATLASRSLLLLVAATGLLLQHFLDSSADMHMQQALSTQNIRGVLPIQNLLACIFVFIAFLLFSTMFRKQKLVSLEIIALFGVGLLSLLCLFPHWNTTDQQQLYPVAFYIIFALLLAAAFAVVFVLAFIAASFAAMRQKNIALDDQHDEEHRERTKIDYGRMFCVRLIIVLTCIGITVAQWFFGASEVLFIRIQLDSQGSVSFTLDQALFAVLAFLTMVALWRLVFYKPKRMKEKEFLFSGVNRLIVFVTVITGALLLFVPQDRVQAPLQGIGQLLEPFFAPLPTFLVLCTLAAVVVMVYLWWQSTHARLMRVLTFIVLGAIVLQLFWPYFLLVALIALQLEVFLTIDAQRVLVQGK